MLLKLAKRYKRKERAEKPYLVIEDKKLVKFTNLIKGNEYFPIFFHDNIFFRGVPKEREQFFIKFFASGLPQKLIAMNLMPETKLSNYRYNDFNLLIEQKPVLFPLSPAEWTFTMLKQAAISVLRLNQIASEYGYATFDCHGFNVLFNGAHPQFVDIGSFVECSANGVWWATDEFIRCYLYPLKLWSEGQFYLAQRLLADHYWNRFFPEDKTYQENFKHLLHSKTNFDALIELVANFQKKQTNSLWKDYHNNLEKNIRTDFNDGRFDKIISIVKKLNIKLAHDIGGNGGAFTRALLKNTLIEKCLCSDMDENAIDSFYEIASNNEILKDKATCALLNLMAPIENYKVKSVFYRFNTEAIFVLAVLHHLLIGVRASLDAVLQTLIQYTSQYIFIEFMPYSHIDGKTRTSSSEFENYTENWFTEHFERYFEIVQIERSELNRVLFVGKKNTESKKNLSSKSTGLDQVKVKVKVDIPVLLILQDIEDLKIFEYLDDIKFRNLLVAVPASFYRTEAFFALDKWLIKNCHSFVVKKTKNNSINSSYKAIDDFFSQVEYGIVIESGIVPAKSFFEYAAELLQLYQKEKSVLQISAINFCNNDCNENQSSYIFTHSFYGGVFATWKDRWEKFKNSTIDTNACKNRLERYYAIKSKKDWKFKWILFGLQNNYIAVQPALNLVKFIRKNESINYLHTLPMLNMNFPIKQPNEIKSNSKYDDLVNTDFLNPHLPFFQPLLHLNLLPVLLSTKFKKIEINLDKTLELKINIKNCGKELLSSLRPFPVKIFCKWINVIANNDMGMNYIQSFELYDDAKIDIGGLKISEYLFLLPEEDRDFLLKLDAPKLIGCYKLEIWVVQENVDLFERIMKKLNRILKKNILQINVHIKK